MSALVWLDYLERERGKCSDVVDLLGEHDRRDELGIGFVRDAFADMLTLVQDSIFCELNG